MMNKPAGTLSRYEKFLVQRALQQPAFRYTAKVDERDRDLEQRISITAGLSERRMVAGAELAAIERHQTARAIAKRLAERGAAL